MIDKEYEHKERENINREEGRQMSSPCKFLVDPQSIDLPFHSILTGALSMHLIHQKLTLFIIYGGLSTYVPLSVV